MTTQGGTDRDDYAANLKNVAELQEKIVELEGQARYLATTPQYKRQALGQCLTKCTACAGDKRCTAKQEDRVARQIKDAWLRLAIARMNLTASYVDGLSPL